MYIYINIGAEVRIHPILRTCLKDKKNGAVIWVPKQVDQDANLSVLRPEEKTHSIYCNINNGRNPMNGNDII